MRLLISIIIVMILLAASPAAAYPPLPPPSSPIALAVINPVDHLWKVITNTTSTVIQAAPGSPLLLYVNNMSLSVWVDGQLIREGNSTYGRIVLVEELAPGFHSVQVSCRNASISIYVLSPAEEAAQAATLRPVGDPWYYKYVYAVIASLAALAAGYPLGIVLRERRESRKLKKQPYEELRGEPICLPRILLSII